LKTACKNEQLLIRRRLADYGEVDTRVVGDPDGLNLSFYPRGLLQCIRWGSTILVNLIMGCPLAGGLQRLYVEILNPGGQSRIIPLIGPGSKAHFRADEMSAVWIQDLEEGRLIATWSVNEDFPGWVMRVQFLNSANQACSWRICHGLDVGLTTPAEARSNEAYVSQYIDHRKFEDSRRGLVVASRQNLPVHGKNPALLQSIDEGCSECLTDARDFFGGMAERVDRLPRALRDPSGPFAGVRQGESSFVALRSTWKSTQEGEVQAFHYRARFLEDVPLESDSSLLEQLDLSETGSAPGPVDGMTKLSADLEPPSLFEAPEVVHGESVGESALATFFTGSWMCCERASDGSVLSFFYGDEYRHVVTRLKEEITRRPHAAILRSGGGFYPEPCQWSTTCFASGIFQSLLSYGHISFHRLLSHPREMLGLTATAGQRIWIRSGRADSWKLLGIPSFFEMGLEDVRWIYLLGTRKIEVRVLMEESQTRLQIEVLTGEPAEFMVTHGLVGGTNEFDERAEWEMDRESASCVVKASMENPYRIKHPEASFLVRANPVEAVAEMGGVECVDEDASDLPLLVVRTRVTDHLCIVISGGEGAGGHRNGSHLSWKESISHLRFKGEQEGVGELGCILPWFIHNSMIHFSAPHGIEQYNGGAWGTRDVTQGSVEVLLALGRHEECRWVILDVYRHQYDDEHDWPQWYMLEPFGDVQQPHSHGDIPLWPLKALGDYLEATGDASILDVSVPWFSRSEGTFGRPTTLRDHVEKNVVRLRQACYPGTALLRYGEGDWNDALQPAREDFRERMVSSWTVALSYQVVRRLEKFCTLRNELWDSVGGFAEEIREDFHRFLVIDAVVCGFFLFDAEEALTGKPLLHPADNLTGIRHRLIPMTRAILAGLFDGQQAQRHLNLIEEKLWARDGVRLMDRPPEYRGGRSTFFQRAESSPCFSREIGLMYTHAHLRTIEALAHMGEADRMWKAVRQVNPAGLSKAVPHALPRQANAYFSSSDAVVASRYEAQDRYDEIRQGKVPVDGGWRIYSSGPGIFVSLILTRLLGFRRFYEEVIIDPVLPHCLSGIEVTLPWAGHALSLRFTVRDGVHTPKAIRLNGTPLEPQGLSENPYRTGGWKLNAKEFEDRFSGRTNVLEIQM
jgi:cellobiose phosphorylase